MSTRRQPRRYWESLLVEVERAGSVVEVARRRGVNERTLSWWCWKLRGERSRAASAGAPRLLPIVVRDLPVEPSSPEVVTVELGDVRLRIERGFDVHYAARLVRALRAC